MAGYPDLDELDKLWPDEGYAIIIEDEMKPPDSDDFVNILSQHDSADFELPSGKSMYSYWVHDAEGNRYYRDEWQIHRARKRLGAAVQTVLDDHPVDERLQELKQTGQRWWERDDALWFALILSHATLQDSSGAQIVVDEDDQIDEHRYGSVAFRTIDQVDPDRRNQYLEARLDGNVRYQDKKAKAIEDNFDRVKTEYGDPAGLKRAFQERDGTDAKLEFLQQFDQIGPKYARNILIDLHHEDGRDCVAIDSRIEGILEAVEYPLEDRSYEDHEQFLQSVAADVDLEPWELDRTLYNFDEEVRNAL